ncbi:MAG: DUF1761 domain-containing protein [Bacteroidetes bacterium]|nr:MAG: DUF1761 domain-containing protein [Bacteroidota bacterium]
MDFSGFNWGEVFVAALSTFVAGYLWYVLLFGRSWKQLLGLKDEALKKGNFLLIFGLSFLLAFIIALFLSFMIEVVMMLGSGALAGAAFGGLICLVFVATTFGINYLFARRPLKLYLIDVGYMLVAFMLMGLIMGAWV